MIPKIIHYCWFGGNPLPDRVKELIATWRNYCPQYEVIQWNENNFNIQENSYCQEAAEAQKWAFVSDYARLKVLYLYGGFYLDTDVEVCKSLDPLLKYKAVIGYESQSELQTGVIGACPKHDWIKLLLEQYNNKHFQKENGSYNTTTNVEIITNATKRKYNIQLKGEYKNINNQLLILPFECLCAKSKTTGEIITSELTYTIHHFSGSWLTQVQKKYQHDCQKYYITYRNYLPKKVVNVLSKVLATYDNGGISLIIKKIFNKV